VVHSGIFTQFYHVKLILAHGIIKISKFSIKIDLIQKLSNIFRLQILILYAISHILMQKLKHDIFLTVFYKYLLSSVSLTLKQKIFVNSKNVFLQ
jgi:hypothetical protein